MTGAPWAAHPLGGQLPYLGQQVSKGRGSCRPGLGLDFSQGPSGCILHSEGPSAAADPAFPGSAENQCAKQPPRMRIQRGGIRGTSLGGNGLRQPCPSNTSGAKVPTGSVLTWEWGRRPGINPPQGQGEGSSFGASPVSFQVMCTHHLMTTIRSPNIRLCELYVRSMKILFGSMKSGPLKWWNSMYFKRPPGNHAWILVNV